MPRDGRRSAGELLGGGGMDVKEGGEAGAGGGRESLLTTTLHLQKEEWTENALKQCSPKETPVNPRGGSRTRSPAREVLHRTGQEWSGPGASAVVQLEAVGSLAFSDGALSRESRVIHSHGRYPSPLVFMHSVVSIAMAYSQAEGLQQHSLWPLRSQ